MTKKYRAAAVAAVLAGALAVPAIASAEIRQGAMSDPVGDSQGGPTRDITNVTASYDTNGQISATVTLAAAPTAEDRTFLSFAFASPSGNNQCSGVTASMFGSSGGTPSVTVTNVSGIGDGYGTTNGNVVTFTSFQRAFENKDWRCVTLTTRQSGAPAGTPNGDSLDIPVYFNGFAPDADSDGVPDYKDACPAVAAPGTPNGCVVIAPAPAPAPVPATTPTDPGTGTAPGAGAGGPSTTTPSETPKLLSAGTVKTVKRGKGTGLKLTLKNTTAALFNKGAVTLKLPVGIKVKVGKKYKAKTVTIPVSKLGAGKSRVLSLKLSTTKKAKKQSTITAKVAWGKTTATATIPVKLR